MENTNTNTNFGEPGIMQVFLGGCQELPEVKIRVRTPGVKIERANIDIEITKPPTSNPTPSPTPSPTPKSKATIKPTAFGDEVGESGNDTGIGTLASVTDANEDFLKVIDANDGDVWG